uniref:Uncharacterized protein n=1 Tax=Romanomermis culicivorax TaxID=13658 RepID=A0A915JA34_ROMCU
MLNFVGFSKPFIQQVGCDISCTITATIYHEPTCRKNSLKLTLAYSKEFFEDALTLFDAELLNEILIGVSIRQILN